MRWWPRANFNGKRDSKESESQKGNSTCCSAILIKNMQQHWLQYFSLSALSALSCLLFIHLWQHCLPVHVQWTSLRVAGAWPRVLLWNIGQRRSDKRECVCECVRERKRIWKEARCTLLAATWRIRNMAWASQARVSERKHENKIYKYVIFSVSFVVHFPSLQLFILRSFSLFLSLSCCRFMART